MKQGALPAENMKTESRPTLKQRSGKMSCFFSSTTTEKKKMRTLKKELPWDGKETFTEKRVIESIKYFWKKRKCLTRQNNT
jgi:hypothetical protein